MDNFAPATVATPTDAVTPSSGTASQPKAPPRTAARHSTPDRDNIAQLVETFYGGIRGDALLGPVFASVLDGHWHSHLPKMVDFWSSLVLRDKSYQGNVKARHQPLTGLTPEHFQRWLSLFLETVAALFEPAAAVQFMEPALRIAHSLQLSHFGWDFKLPAAQQAVLDSLRPRHAAAD